MYLGCRLPRLILRLALGRDGIFVAVVETTAFVRSLARFFAAYRSWAALTLSGFKARQRRAYLR